MRCNSCHRSTFKGQAMIDFSTYHPVSGFSKLYDNLLDEIVDEEGAASGWGGAVTDWGIASFFDTIPCSPPVSPSLLRQEIVLLCWSPRDFWYVGFCDVKKRLVIDLPSHRSLHLRKGWLEFCSWPWDDFRNRLSLRLLACFLLTSVWPGLSGLRPRMFRNNVSWMSLRELSRCFFTKLGDTCHFCLTGLAFGFKEFLHSFQAGFLGVLPGVVHGLDLFDASDTRIIPRHRVCNSVPCIKAKTGIGVGHLLRETECCPCASNYKEVPGPCPFI